MNLLPQPHVLVSKCLGFASCRYNGLIIHSDFVEQLKPLVSFITVCPEVEIGLGVPREPIRIVFADGKSKLVQLASGRDVTSEMNAFSMHFLNSIKDIDGSILKGRSPSCGIKDVKIYPAAEKSASLKKDKGFFGGAVLEHFPDLPIEDEGRLLNAKIREHFLTRLFLVPQIKNLMAQHSMKELIAFHAQNKYLLMAYNQQEMRVLGRIVANLEKKSLDMILNEYQKHFLSAIAHAPRYTSHINVLMHAAGYFSKELNKEEKRFFNDYLKKYRENKITLSSILGILKSWIVRFNNEYLAQQSYFKPYPEELMELTDSGKGRDEI
ncbi:MAG: cytoplasmic protein [Candidatus Fischerbacteria bacterium RBG_13_37_8]|uniref:Cytoplasmic protein n=1 Tax=Candidatus Fischerbacteria bacterium RBG_13_37_8 TaxID=1817863 RepID=A0A1F5VGJ3_9BACT|nr:MAG: cytoplasmic protein [Candidatus Fischerbacteria bacterium RBG_13_37_8]